MITADSLAIYVGGQIYKRRRAKGYKKSAFAEMCGFSKQSLDSWERGVRTPTLHNLFRLADALKCNVSDLLPKEEKK